jgi:K+-transporting ATPase ATPase C chain
MNMSPSKNIRDTHDPDSFTSSHSPDAAHESGGSILGHLWSSIAATVVLTIICCGIYPAIVWGIAQVIFPNQANGSLVKKDGSYTTKDDEAVGSALLGQNFAAAQYFHPRPSSAGAGYDAANSSGSNLGPLSSKLLKGTIKSTTMPATQPGGDPVPGPDAVDFDGISLRVVHYCLENNLPLEFSASVDAMKDKDGNLDDVKLVKAFNDDKSPLTVHAKTPIPADAVTASGSGLDPHISPANAAIQKARIAKARGISADDVQKLIDQHTDGPDLGILGDPGVNVLMVNLALDAKYPLAPATQPAK